jgi:EEF1A lysine methyltransferase 4
MNKSSAREFSLVSYWDNHYSAESKDPQSGSNESYDWYRTFEHLRPFLERHLPSPTPTTTSSSSSASPRILHLGCGTSALTTSLLSLGYRNQCSVDFSPVVIQTMRTRYAGLEAEGEGEGSLEWRVVDVRHMSFPPQCFDVAIDKGTLDAMIYGEATDLEEEAKANAKAYVDEVVRVLKPGGKWLCVTFWPPPQYVRPLIEREGVWAMEVETLKDEGGAEWYSGFVMTKHR